MSHGNPGHGQPSPPHSSHYDDLGSEYVPSPVPTNRRPYTPPISHPVSGYNYGDPEEYEYHGDYYDHGIVYHTPPRTISSNGMQTRSGRSLGTPMSSGSHSSRISPSPRGRKNRNRKEKATHLRLPHALSIIAQEQNIPVEDMNAWINRSSETRQSEVTGKHKNKVPRPMNSFMLYRMAYKQTIKQWSAQGDNNQAISAIAGESWREHEPKDLKDHFAQLAEQEKTNHAAAFPAYKFAPRKDTKKRDRDDDDTDGEWESSSYSSKRRRGRFGRDVTRSRSTTPASMMYAQPYPHPSSYQASNPQTMPVYMYPHEWVPPTQITYNSPQQYEYYHAPQPMYAPTSAPQHEYGSELVGLPPGLEPPFEPRVEAQYAMDPALAYGGEYYPAAVPQPQVEARERAYVGGEERFHPGEQTLAPAESLWSPTAGHPANAFDAEFDSWSH